MQRDLVVFLSSAHHGLEPHRAIAEKAINGGPMAAGRFMKTSMTETRGPSPLPPLAACLERVRSAHAVVLIVGFRYGTHVPDDSQGRSYTEAEYDEAMRLGKPLLVFIATTARVFERDAIDPDRSRINAFRSKVLAAQEQRYTAQYFGDLEDFATLIGRTVGETLTQLLAHAGFHGEQGRLNVRLEELISDPFDGMNDRVLIGRGDDWKEIDRWFEDPATPCLILQAEGGMGKSSLAWEWYNALDRRTSEKWAERVSGKMWWSCYDLGRTLRALGHRLRRWIETALPEDYQTVEEGDWEALLFYLEQMDLPPFLVIDGLEAEFIGYVGRRPGNTDREAAQSQSLGAKFASSSGLELPADDGSRDPFTDFIDDRAGAGLLALIRNNLIKVLFTTRHTPETFKDKGNVRTGLKRGIRRKTLEVLDAESAKKILDANDVFGSSQIVDRLLASAAYRHPLLLTGFAAAVREDPLATGDLDLYLSRIPDIDLSSMLRRDGRRFDILSFTLKGLNELEEYLLDIIATHDRPLSAKLIIELAQRQPDTSERAVLDSLRNLETNRSLIYSSVQKDNANHAPGKRYSMHPVYRMYIGQYRSGQVQAMAAALRPEYEKELFEGIGRSGGAITQAELDERIVPVIDLSFKARELQHAWSHFHYLTEARERFGLYRLAYDRIKAFVSFEGRDGNRVARCLIEDRDTALAVLREAGELLRLFGDIEESRACLNERARLLEGSKEISALADNTTSLLLVEGLTVDREAYAARIGECVEFIMRNRQVSGLNSHALIAITEAGSVVDRSEYGRLRAISGFLLLSAWPAVDKTTLSWHLRGRMRHYTSVQAVGPIELVARSNCLADSPREDLLTRITVIESLLHLGRAGRAREIFDRIAESNHWEELDFAHWPEYARFVLRIAELKGRSFQDPQQALQMERGFDEVLLRYLSKQTRLGQLEPRLQKVQLLLAAGQLERARKVLNEAALDAVDSKLPRADDRVSQIRSLAEQLGYDAILKWIAALPAGYRINQLDRDPVYGFQPSAGRLPPIAWG